MIQLEPDREHRIAEALSSGAYRSEDEVINRALDVLHEQDQWLSANRSAIHAVISRGIDELERGEGIPEDQLEEYIAMLKTQPE